ncbi:50S ribosomal protein L31e [Candidatus Woesearchaeota archaeon]|nr:50S ribosomal protein L31e [Candidatus Woesearchaeota archaeon]
MAKPKTETKTLERTYNIPLRKEYLKVPNWKRTNKAVSAVKKFLKKHMKSDDVKLGKRLNEKLWQHGIKNPPHHIKVTTVKDGKGVVKAELFGYKIETKKKEAKKLSKLEEVAKKAGIKMPKKLPKEGLEKSKSSQRAEKKVEDKLPPPQELKPAEPQEQPQETKEKTKPTESTKTQKAH